jgi:AraC family transcriptional regulator
VKKIMSWRGKVLLWEEYGLFFGRAGDASIHASPAIKICISLDGNFGLRISDENNWTNHRAAVIHAGQSHAIDGRGVSLAMLLIAPEGTLGQLFSGEGIDDIPDQTMSSILPLLHKVDDANTATQAYEEVVRKIAENYQPAMTDPRVAQSIEWLRVGREQGIIVGEIAAGVDLSEGRFSHLFTEHVRIPVRRYLLWLRLREALHLLANGGSLTETAHQAGFADSAHLSRTFRTALGIAPSDLIKGSTLVSYL